MSRYVLGLLLLTPFTTGCQHFLVRTQNRIAFDHPMDTRVTTDIPPVSPTAGRVQAVPVRAGNSATKVAVIDIDGLLLNTPFVGPSSLGENPVSLFREKLDAVEADGCVKAVVLRVNSPGGGVAASMTMRHDLERFKLRSGLPVVACLLDTAAGGAYLIASAADQIVAGPATVTGGVGVVLNLYNLADSMRQFNVIPQGIKAGKYTDLGSSTRSLEADENKEDKVILQAMADEFHAQLKADILKSRPGIDLANGTTFDGRIFTASQAVARKLVDRVGDLDDAIDLAASSGGCPERPAAVLYRRTNDPAHSVYAVTANVPLQGAGVLPSVPGLERSRMPTFLSLWQPDPTIEKMCGK
jgi:protease-4